jgi:hypothetical protein
MIKGKIKYMVRDDIYPENFFDEFKEICFRNGMASPRKYRINGIVWNIEGERFEIFLVRTSETNETSYVIEKNGHDRLYEILSAWITGYMRGLQLAKIGI